MRPEIDRQGNLNFAKGIRWLDKFRAPVADNNRTLQQSDMETVKGQGENQLPRACQLPLLSCCSLFNH
jgi:hypothetical protein